MGKHTHTCHDEAMPDPEGGFRRHSALYDAEQTARLYGKLVRMLAAGEKIYAHLPAGVTPAADSVDAPTYLDYRMPSDRRDEVRRLGACWDAIRSRYYVPAGVSSKNVHQPWPLALKCDARRMSCEIPD